MQVFCDNYLDGGYHVPYAHGALASGLQLQSYETLVLSANLLSPRKHCPYKILFRISHFSANLRVSTRRKYLCNLFEYYFVELCFF
jgi:transposase-like protein